MRSSRCIALESSVIPLWIIHSGFSGFCRMIETVLLKLLMRWLGDERRCSLLFLPHFSGLHTPLHHAALSIFLAISHPHDKFPSMVGDVYVTMVWLSNLGRWRSFDYKGLTRTGSFFLQIATDRSREVWDNVLSPMRRIHWETYMQLANPVMEVC